MPQFLHQFVCGLLVQNSVQNHASNGNIFRYDRPWRYDKWQSFRRAEYDCHFQMKTYRLVMDWWRICPPHFDMTAELFGMTFFPLISIGGFSSCHNEKIIILFVIEKGQLHLQKCVPTCWGWFSVKDGHFGWENHSRKTNEIDHFGRVNHLLWFLIDFHLSRKIIRKLRFIPKHFRFYRGVQSYLLLRNHSATQNHLSPILKGRRI